MWELKAPKPVKLIIGILAADERCLSAGSQAVAAAFGPPDLVSEIWPFTQTRYYEDQTGSHILRQFVSIEKLIDPAELAGIKHRTNGIEQELARTLTTQVRRPVNLDPGIIEPSKLVLATTKNFSHRVYIGQKMYAEVTLLFDKGTWYPLPYTYADYRGAPYQEYFSAVRNRLVQQLRSMDPEKKVR